MQLEKKMHEQNEKFDEIKTTKTKKQKAMKLFSRYLFKYFSTPHSLSPETPKTIILGCLKLSQSSLMHFSFMSFCLSMVYFRYISLLCLQVY